MRTVDEREFAKLLGRFDQLTQRMGPYILRRLLGTIPTLLVIITLAFVVMRLAPGGPFDDEQSLPPEIMANLQTAYGLDQPVHVQYAALPARSAARRPRAVVPLQGLSRHRADRAGAAGHR